MSTALPRIGLTCGDLNGIGMEVVLKTLSDPQIHELCRPVLFATPKAFAYHRKAADLPEIPYSLVSNLDQPHPENRIALVEPWTDQVLMELGKPNPELGIFALKSLDAGIDALKKGQIDALVTAPIDKEHIPLEGFSGHTSYLGEQLGGTPLMVLSGPTLRVALVTEHIPLVEVATRLTSELLSAKIQQFRTALQQDFGVQKPKIAVLALNPHAGDRGRFGTQDAEVVAPAVAKAVEDGHLVYGPYPADGFFGTGQQAAFDGVLALYHDQGLVPFKMLHFQDGVNVTCGLPHIRTSPDHGVAYDLAGKQTADESSFRSAVFEAIDLVRRRAGDTEYASNPLQKRVETKKERH
jgi:4-hydroxythreonine-4-phosphate dehydrogenase